MVFAFSTAEKIDPLSQHYAVTRDQSQPVRATTNFLKSDLNQTVFGKSSATSENAVDPRCLVEQPMAE
jgi:hypothetical protein